MVPITYAEPIMTEFLIKPLIRIGLFNQTIKTKKAVRKQITDCLGVHQYLIFKARPQYPFKI